MEKNVLTLRLKRTCFKNGVADGVLTDENGERICDTVENIGSILQFGNYLLDPRTNYELGIRQYAIYKWPGAGMLLGWLRAGNGAYNLKDSTVIVGESLVHGVVIHSLQCLDRIAELAEACTDKNTVMLVV